LPTRRRPGPKRSSIRAEAGEEILVPAHWPLEVANGLLVAQRKGRVTEAQVGEFLEDLAALQIRAIAAAAEQLPALLRLAKQYHLTAYDEAYLDLAQRTGLPRREQGRCGHRRSLWRTRHSAASVKKS
jgi:predicted nucleic acid-binding protein